MEGVLGGACLWCGVTVVCGISDVVGSADGLSLVVVSVGGKLTTCGTIGSCVGLLVGYGLVDLNTVLVGEDNKDTFRLFVADKNVGLTGSMDSYCFSGVKDTAEFKVGPSVLEEVLLLYDYYHTVYITIEWLMCVAVVWYGECR